MKEKVRKVFEAASIQVLLVKQSVSPIAENVVCSNKMWMIMCGY